MPIDLDEVRKKHRSSRIELTPNVTICLDCGRDWPCDAIQLVDEVEALREVVERLTFFQIQNKELREALEEIRTKPAQAGQGYSFLGGQLREIARVALGKPPGENGESE